MAAPVPVEEELWEVQFAPGEVKRMTLDQLDDAFRLGVIGGDTLIRELGQVDWLELSLVADLDSPSAIPPDLSATSSDPAPLAAEFSPSSEAVTPSVAVLPNVAVLPETIVEAETPKAPETAEMPPAAEDVAVEKAPIAAAPSVRLTAPGLAPTPSILGAKGAASLGIRPQPRTEPTPASPKAGSGAARVSIGRSAQRSSSAIQKSHATRPAAAGTPRARGSEDNPTYSRLRPSGPAAAPGTGTAKAPPPSSSPARGLSAVPERPIAKATVLAPKASAGVVDPLAAPSERPAPAAQAAGAPVEPLVVEAEASLEAVPSAVAEPLGGVVTPRVEARPDRTEARPDGPADAVPASLAARAAIPSLPPNAFAHLFTAPPEPVQQRELPPISGPSGTALDSLAPGPFREALAAYPASAPPAAAWVDPYPPTPAPFPEAGPAPATAPIGSFLPPGMPVNAAPPPVVEPNAFRAAPFTREPLESIAPAVSPRMSKLELTFWLAASLLCLTVVLQRNGALHSLSKALGNEPNYLQIERSLLGAPDLSTPRGVSGMVVEAEPKSNQPAR